MSDTVKTNPSQTRKARDVPQWDITTDVAIVGFGGAGGCAAIEAANAGSSTVIFELASASGGSTAMSSAEIYMGGSGGTRVQQACGFQDDTEDMVTYMMMAAGPQADEEKIRNYCENSQAHFQWLVDLGVPSSRLRTVSFGEDRPAVQGHDESAWRYNRRADFVN